MPLPQHCLPIVIVIFVVFVPFRWLMQTQNTVYEIVSEMNTRQDVLEERLVTMEEKLTLLQETLESLPDALSRCIQLQLQQQQQQQQQQVESSEQQRKQQYLHPETSYTTTANSPVISHSKSVPNTWNSQSAASSTTTGCTTQSAVMKALPSPAPTPTPAPTPSPAQASAPAPAPTTAAAVAASMNAKSS